MSVSPVDVPSGSVGIIETCKGMGSGFVALSSAHVITCRHVLNGVPDTSNVFYAPATKPGSPPSLLHKVKVTVEKKLLDTDLAILRADKPICSDPIPFGCFASVCLQDRVYYVGFDGDADPLTIKCGEVVTIGKAWLRDENVTVDALDVESKKFASPGPAPVLAAHGFSGGPVLNEKGKVVAVLAGGWKKKFLNGPCYRFVNRAVSVGPLTSVVDPK